MMRVLLEIVVGLTTGMLAPMARFGVGMLGASALSAGSYLWWRRRRKGKDEAAK